MFRILVDYDATAVSDILNIYKYLMKKKRNSIKMFELVKRVFVSAMMFFGYDLSSINP